MYWLEFKKEAKVTGNITAARNLFNEAERHYPIREEEKIKIENIHGKLILIGAKDDTLWEAHRYIARMKERLESKPRKCEYEAYIYEHATHYIFP